jgi:hypothetical protein
MTLENTPVVVLESMALAVALGTGAALLLALVAAGVFLALEELGLRRVTNTMTIWTWLVTQDPALRSEAPSLIRIALQLRARLPHAPHPLREQGGELKARADQLQRALGVQAPAQAATSASASPMPPSPQTQPPKAEAQRAWPEVDVLWDVLGAAVALPARQLLGVLSASIQADAASPSPSRFAVWIAAMGSLPIQPSPFATVVSTPTARGVPANAAPVAGAGAASAPRVLADAEPKEQQHLRILMQRCTERALDSLQAQLARGWNFTRYAVSLMLVIGISSLLTANPVAWSVSPARSAPPSASFWNVAVFAPNVALWLIAAAYVPVFLGLLERMLLRAR